MLTVNTEMRNSHTHISCFDTLDDLGQGLSPRYQGHPLLTEVKLEQSSDRVRVHHIGQVYILSFIGTCVSVCEHVHACDREVNHYCSEH